MLAAGAYRMRVQAKSPSGVGQSTRAAAMPQPGLVPYAVSIPLPGAVVLAVAGRRWAPACHVVVGKVFSANLVLVRDGPVETAQGHPLMCRFSRRAAAVSLASLPGTPSSSPARTAGGPCACFPLAYLFVDRHYS